MALAEQLMRTCYEMYRQVPTGVAPERVVFTVLNAAQSQTERGVCIPTAATLPCCAGAELPHGCLQAPHVTATWCALSSSAGPHCVGHQLPLLHNPYCMALAVLVPYLRMHARRESPRLEAGTSRSTSGQLQT